MIKSDRFRLVGMKIIPVLELTSYICAIDCAYVQDSISFSNYLSSQSYTREFVTCFFFHCSISVFWQITELSVRFCGIRFTERIFSAFVFARVCMRLSDLLIWLFDTTHQYVLVVILKWVAACFPVFSLYER